MKTIRVRSKIWLEFDGRPLLGDGRERLLLAIRDTGSLNAAAARLGLSYRKAWAQLKQMEEHAPFRLVVRSKGGRGGGSTRLTGEAERLLDRYARIRTELQRLVDERFGDGE
ncbi:molybdate transport system regulatory protein [Geothermobacter ehrlichii]|uniref:Molybdate transport system regulatory protein n=1 Tax=Geothermobacter ehrlichii TaxID=213224 RepID=A0A5D3WK80_9BACT|nr:LysR family transcriptional regulator [Geothermobacter ehrlichii]TYO96692.1 molybdate transport system regulatory protein [Geothermobacter ehrlichii]